MPCSINLVCRLETKHIRRMSNAEKAPHTHKKHFSYAAIQQTVDSINVVCLSGKQYLVAACVWATVSTRYTRKDALYNSRNWRNLFHSACVCVSVCWVITSNGSAALIKSLALYQATQCGTHTHSTAYEIGHLGFIRNRRVRHFLKVYFYRLPFRLNKFRCRRLASLHYRKFSTFTAIFIVQYIDKALALFYGIAALFAYKSGKKPEPNTIPGTMCFIK